jgi:hypothetical protein
LDDEESEANTGAPLCVLRVLESIDRRSGYHAR